MAAPAAELPLTGTRILDLSRLLPGAYATLVLSDLGAQIDKLEDPKGGDPLRAMPPFLDNESAYFHALNRNKRSLALDLRSPAGIEVFRRLVRHYDVLVESNRPGVMRKLGLSVESLLALNPKLIGCSLSGYGQTGPDSLKAGHDLNYVARVGLLGYGGTEAAPAMPGGQTADIGGALFAAIGILAALEERRRTGKGRWIDVSLTEGAMAFVHFPLAAWALLGGKGPAMRRGADMLNGGNPCYNLYRTRDGRWLAVGALEPKFATRFLELLGVPVPDEFPFLGQAAKTLKEQIAAKIEQRDLSHWLSTFHGEDACVEAVLEGDEVLRDPQLLARENFVPSQDDRVESSPRSMMTPLRFGKISPSPAPALGAHSRQILSEAGISAEEIKRLG